MAAQHNMRRANPSLLGWFVAAALLAGLPALAQAPPGPPPPQGQQPAAKPAAQQPAAEPKKEETAPPPDAAASETAPAGQARRRDPFVSLKRAQDPTQGGTTGRVLPPGKAGLVITQLRVEGIVLGARGRIAVVKMEGKERAFFLREGEQVYDGTVMQILGDRVVFREKTKDIFGRNVERDVVKQLTTATP